MSGTYGQDWSSFQDPAPSTAGLGFAVVKRTEGLGYVNPDGAQQVAHARTNGLVVGHYHYPHMANSPAAEADRFLQVAGAQLGDFVVLDWEGYDDANKAVPFSTQVSYKGAWLAHARAAVPQLQVGTYANTDYLNRDPKGVYGDFLWIATADRPAGQPGISRDWLFHQYGASGIDRDYCPLTLDQLRAWSHAKEDDMPLTQADADLIVKTLMDRAVDDPTTSDNSTKRLVEMLWDTGRNAGQANANAGVTLTKVNGLAVGGVDLDQLAAKVAALLPKPPTAADLATELAKRLQS